MSQGGAGRFASRASRLTRIAVRWPLPTLALATGFAIVSLALASVRLELRTSNLDLVDPDLPEVRRFLDFSQEFGTPNVLAIGLEGGDPEGLRAAAARLGLALASTPGARRVDYRLPYAPEALGWHGIDPYFVSRDGALLLLFVQPDDPYARVSTLAPMIEEIDRRIADLDLAARGIRVSTTGLPQYAIDDRDTIRGDVSRLSVLAFLLVLLLFAGAFGAFLRPLAAMAVLALSVSITLGAAALYPGHLTLVSAFFASILFGLGVDFGIHFIDRFEGLLAQGLEPRLAAEETAARLAIPLGLGAATTASAFLALAFCGFRGFAELGVVAAAGILICLLNTFVVLPPLLVWTGGRRGGERGPGDRWIGAWLGRPRPLIALAICGLALAAVGGLPEFDGNYLDLQPAGSPAVRLEREIVARSGWSPQFAAFTVDSKEAAWDRVNELREERKVGEIRSILDLDRLRYLGVVSEAEEDAFRSRFASSRGRYAIYAYPSGDIWEPEFQREFLARMRALDAGVTGMPFLGEFMVERSRRAIDRGASISAAAVLVWLWFGFRRWLPALLALLPAALGVAATAAVMRLAGVALNPIDVMAFPVIIGIAVDDGVHLVHRFCAEGGDLVRTLGGAGRSVLLTSLTSVAAFGALAWARHQGLASLGLVLALGVTVALAASIFVLPWALTRCSSRLLASSARVPASQPRRMAASLALLLPVLGVAPALGASSAALERDAERPPRGSCL